MDHLGLYLFPDVLHHVCPASQQETSGGSIVLITWFMLLFTKEGSGSVHNGREYGFKSCLLFSCAVLDDLANFLESQVHTANLLEMWW